MLLPLIYIILSSLVQRASASEYTFFRAEDSEGKRRITTPLSNQNWDLAEYFVQQTTNNEQPLYAIIHRERGEPPKLLVLLQDMEQVPRQQHHELHVAFLNAIMSVYSCQRFVMLVFTKAPIREDLMERYRRWGLEIRKIQDDQGPIDMARLVGMDRDLAELWLEEKQAETVQSQEVHQHGRAESRVDCWKHLFRSTRFF